MIPLIIYLVIGLSLAIYLRVTTKEKSSVAEHLIIVLLWPVIPLAASQHIKF